MNLKKTMVIATAAAAMVATAALGTYAHSTDEGAWFDISSRDTADAGFALAKNVADNWWLRGGMENLGRTYSSVTADAIYTIPKGFLFLKFYCGAGMEVALDSGAVDNHVLLGTRVWCFFNETQFSTDGFEHRGGIRINF